MTESTAERAETRELRVPHVPDRPSLAQRANGWRYAALTTNPPHGHVDFVTRAIVITRAAVLPMTLFAGLVAGLLAVRQPGFAWGWFLLALLGILLAHVANNVMNDLFDTEVGQDTAAYPRAQYAPHPILAGLTTRRQLAADRARRERRRPRDHGRPGGGARAVGARVRHRRASCSARPTRRRRCG